MPYIKELDRKKYDSLIEDVVDALTGHGFEANSTGDINYVISNIIWQLFDKQPSYKVANELMGVIECVKQEFYRRRVSPYEDEKIHINGDICKIRIARQKI